jgi:multiple sugar transport system permease protein
MQLAPRVGGNSQNRVELDELKFFQYQQAPMTSFQKRKFRESFEAYLYLFPSLLILGIFWFLPVFVSFFMSFGNITALKPMDQMEFVGLRQYTDALSNEAFQQTLWNTVNYVIYHVPATLTLALGAALLLNSQIKGRGFFRTIYFLPYVTTWVAIAIVFKYLFHREYGLGNWMLQVISLNLFGLDHAWRLEWLSEPRGIWEMFFFQPILGDTLKAMPLGIDNLIKGPSLSLFSIIMTSVWRDIGYFMVIFLAGLQNIDRSLYEAASIDGASKWQQFRNITFPLLSPVTFFLLIISMISSFKVFVPMFMMTPTGGPNNSTTPLVMYLYEQGFTGEWKLSYAAAVAYILTLIILLITLLQNLIFGRRVEYGN